MNVLTAPLEELDRVAAEVRARHRSLLLELRVELTEHGAVLRGKATTFYGKQVAFHEVRRRVPMAVVANRIEVLQSPTTR